MIENILLLREKHELPDATLGVIYRDNAAVCCTLELPWLDNQKKISCIPKGEYKVTRYNSPSKGKVFLLHDVPNRSMIEIHKGNTVDDIEGCIVVGRTYGKVKGKRAVIHSANTLERLLDELPKEFILNIE
jgi:hypothetical protein